ncbi:AraC family transcriptional regulator [Fulvivirgaceae bacterium PWU4]|uniref:AraC family transcriptional regulator n=1 Tax=Chryseosolibacter histidini TaxID=2782349 RepID=A0AAP2DL24_9BACT|nr:AraC family transcriptional regulator [Chryseosolibacter histidini]MBT1698326.1 AraC family transcriptional regulator [Chryseosolibacter histidini]
MDYIFIICTLAVGHSLFMALTLLIIGKKRANRLLALLLFLLALRVGKSVVGMFFLPGMVYELSAVGVVAMAAIGPVLVLLVKSLFVTSPPSRNIYWHFLPAALLPFILPLSGWKVLGPAYYTITLHVLIYIILCYWLVWSNRSLFRTDDLKWKWALNLLAAVSLLWCSFVLQVTVYQRLIYAVNVITAALVFYALSLWAIKRARIFLPDPRQKSEPTDTEAYEALGKQIRQMLEAEQIFTDPNLTVTSLAARLKVQPYLLSRAINYFFKKSFSELLIQYRIKKAEQLLLSPQHKNYTVEAIAFESGFNTPSAFYAAFKKIHKTTPARFKVGN